MKCPNCGEEIKEGYLYCEKCGEDIHIVPDFEPELELSLIQSVGEILDEEEKEREAERQRLLERKKKLQKVIKGCILAGIIGIVVISCVFMVKFVKNAFSNSYEYQIEKAYICISEGKIEEALPYLKRALELNPEDMTTKLELAEVYRILKGEMSYVDVLKEVAYSKVSSEQEVETAYRKLVSFYVSKENYETVNVLLKDCSVESVLKENQKYIAEMPFFSYEEGVYEEIIPLKLSANTSGTIYYTLDGSLPDENSDKYVSPIFLDTGSHTVSAIFVNSYGVASDVLIQKYVIEIQRPAAPEISVYSGQYSKPVSITVDVMEGCRVFYTTDGSFPTEQSKEYTEPIPMPLGKSYFKFVAYNAEGICSEITSHEYKLVIETEVSVEEACQAVVDLMLQFGKIYNSLGESFLVPGKYAYIFQYPLAVEGKGDYYVITEVYEDESGIAEPTGASYAVNIYNETVYKFTNNNGNYLLEGF